MGLTSEVYQVGTLNNTRQALGCLLAIMILYRRNNCTMVGIFVIIYIIFTGIITTYNYSLTLKVSLTSTKL